MGGTLLLSLTRTPAKKAMDSITFVEKLDLVLRLIVFVPCTLAANVLRNYYLATQRTLPTGEYITIAIIRTFLTCLTPRQIVAVAPSTEATYGTWCRKHGLLLTSKVSCNVYPMTERLENGTKVHWIHDPEIGPRKIILFFHGGGYNAPLSRAHVDWCAALMEDSATPENPVAIAILEYGLTPENRYPSQLRHARNGLQHLLDRGFAPENIIVGGDSAGGHLTLSLLSHLMHTHPQIEKLGLPSRLAGAFLVSPWVTNSVESESFRENAAIDMLSPALVPRGAKDFVSAGVLEQELQAGQGWALALDARSDWWDGLGEVVANLYVTAGEQEMFRDHIIEFVEKLRTRFDVTAKRAPGLQMEIGVKEAHDHILTWHIRGRRDNPALRRLVQWTKAVWKS